MAKICRRLGVALGAGVEARRAWRFETERGSPFERACAARVAALLDQGHSLVDAMTAAGAFPPLVLALVEVGETTGHLPEVFGQLADHHERILAFRRQVLLALAWPALELILAVIVVTVFFLVLALIGSGGENGATDVLGLGWSPAWQGGVCCCAPLGPLGVIVTIALVARRGWFGTAFTRALFALPLVGSWLRADALARLAWALALTLDGGLDTRRAARLALASSQTPYYLAQADAVDQALAQNHELHEAFGRTNAFPADFIDALHTGDLTGHAPEELTRLSQEYERSAEGWLRLLAIVGGALVFLLSAGLVAALVIRMFQVLYLGPIHDALRGI